jgi:phosphohistidine phosphatase
MHRLHLLRHAKSSWDDNLEDSQRPLAKRGREAARLIGETLPAAIGALDLVLCSSALRTRETADLALAGFSPAPKMLYEDGLYLATLAMLIARLRRLDEGCGAAMVIGHNPGLHELAIALAAPGSAESRTLGEGKFPAGVRVSFAIDGNWADLNSQRHEIVGCVTVKSLGGKD